MLTPVKLSTLELIVLIFTSTLVCSGIVISNIDTAWFENTYVVEDGFVENWTIVPLLIAAGYAINRYRKLRHIKTRHFKSTMILIALFSLFVAGEEISWGQRIFNVESTEFFIENNAQGETNLHNMIIGETKINKLVFSQLLVLAVGFYLLAFPILYRRNSIFRQNIDRYGIPIARPYQVISCLLLFISILLIPSGKNAEILEAGITTLFMLIFLFPHNNHNFEIKHFIEHKKTIVRSKQHRELVSLEYD